MADRIPARAKVVVVGGGIVGCSIAYHLTKVGISDVVLVERKQLTSGTTWHAAGLVGLLRASQNQTELQRYAVDLFRSLEEETEQATGFMQAGGLVLALNEARLEVVERAMSFAAYLGLDGVRMISNDELAELWPILNLESIVGAGYIPMNARVNPVDATAALAKGAKKGGAQIFENTKVSKILVRNGRAVGVESEAGTIEAEIVVLACGMWTRELAAGIGVTVPLHAVEHFYIVTEAIPDLPKLPGILCHDERAYYKEDAGKLLVGTFETEGVPWGTAGIPESFEFTSLPVDQDRYAEFLELAVNRVPVLASTGIRTFFVGPESFTPDGRPLVGEAPEVRNLFICAGFNSNGIMSSPGAGKVMAEWIRSTYPPDFAVSGFEVNRMQRFQGTRRYLFDRSKESMGLPQDMPWPGRQMMTARGVRRYALHRDLIEAGASMGERFGWEVPLFFGPRDKQPTIREKMGQQDWFPFVRQECQATRDGVAFYDESIFAKILVQGPDACRILNWVSANNVDVPPGRVVYTQWLNPRGGIEADLTINRLSHETFLILTSPASQRRDVSWLRRHSPDGARVSFTDVTSAYAMFGIMGPKSRELLQELTDADLSHDKFPFSTSREIDLGYALVRATRLTYVGELGFELLVASEFAGHVYERIIGAGAKFGLRHAGFYAMGACRLERGYRHFGHDIGETDTPLDGGLGFAVAWDKPEGFLGREPLMAQRAKKILSHRLIHLRLEDGSDTAPILEHNEPIWRDGVRVGIVTSGGWGFRLEASLGVGYLDRPEGVTPEWIASGRFEVEVALKRHAAAVQLKPFYDPSGQRVRM